MTGEFGRWRCSGCGQYVPHGRVKIGGDGAPRADCDVDGARLVVYYDPPERVDPAAAKVAGQQQSIMNMPGVTRASFLELIQARTKPGDRVSVNTLRTRLDDLGIPARDRGALFSYAVRAGLLQPLWVEAGGVRVRAVESSTGGTAHHAQVRIYERVGEP